MEDVEVIVKKIIAKQLNIPEADVSGEKKLVSDLGVDSVDTLELMMSLEDEFGVEISPEEAKKLATVQLTINYILEHQNA